MKSPFASKLLKNLIDRKSRYPVIDVIMKTSATSSDMAASLRNFPPELIEQIIGNINKSGWLLDFALACRYFHRLTIPYLYTDIRLIYHGPWMRFPYLKPFSGHILSNPGLASYARNFALAGCWGTDDDLSDDEISENVGHNAVIRAAVHKFSDSIDEEEEWMKDFTISSDENAYLCLLLPSLPNLERIDLFIPERPDKFTPYFAKIMLDRIPSRKQPFDIEPAFSSLTVMIDNGGTRMFDETLVLIPSFLRLPSLRELYCQKVDIDHLGQMAGLSQLKTASSSLTHLEIRASSLSNEYLTNLLRACPKLRTFVYELGFQDSSFYKHSALELRQALVSTEANLENLWLDYEPGPSLWKRDDINRYLPMSSLSNFECLKNIKVGLYIFFGLAGISRTGLQNTEMSIRDHNDIIDLANILPASIETLYFAHTNGRIRLLTQALEKLLKQKSLSMPRLRRIAFEAYITGNEEEFDFSRLDALGEEAGVRIDRIDGTALPSTSEYGWEYTPGIDYKGQGMDGSLKWAAEVAAVNEDFCPVYINAGQYLSGGPSLARTVAAPYSECGPYMGS